MAPRTRSIRWRAAALACFGWTLAACAVGPNYETPETEVPDRWHQELMRGLAPGPGSLETWWTFLDDPILASLIQRAGEGNLDLADALARVDEGRARRGIARGDFFPDTDGTGSYSRSRLSNEIVDFAPPPQNRVENFWSVGLDASWEIDVFGRIRRSVESADADLQASIEDYRDVLVALYADVGINYVELRATQQRLRFALQNVSTQRGTLSLTRDRNRAGLVGDLDVRQAEQNLASTESFVPSLRQRIVEVINRLGVLLGVPPSTLHAELAEPTAIPGPPQEILVGIPAELLRQRPDIRRAERDLASQTAQIGVATADLYPRFALLGTFAFDALELAQLFTGKAGNYSFGPAFRWNIFDGGRVRSNIEAQEAITAQLFAQYENTILLAQEEVENAMVAYVQETDRRDALERSAIAAAKAVELVQTLYRTGLTDFQNVLDTERTLFLQQDALAESEGFVTQNLINIYRALGGGWS